MISYSTTVIVTQISCSLSLLGSIILCFTWYYPKGNRLKPGRILLFWLSITDFISSLVYLQQTFYSPGEVDCTISSLLGIYFPVASFLWTDCIAFFLYIVVKTRTTMNAYDWKQLLIYFHAVVWITSAIPVILVASFGHAGRDDTSDNTGGWCWIKGDHKSKQDKFLWEFLGGKFIEWLSCFIVLPLLYTIVGCKLRKVSGGGYSSTIGTQDTSATTSSCDHSSASAMSVSKSIFSNSVHHHSLPSKADNSNISIDPDQSNHLHNHNDDDVNDDNDDDDVEYKDYHESDHNETTVLNILYEASSSIYDKGTIDPSSSKSIKSQSISITSPPPVHDDDEYTYNHSFFYKDFASYSNPFSQSFMNSHGIFDHLIHHHDDNDDDSRAFNYDDSHELNYGILLELDSAALSDPVSSSADSSSFFTRFYLKLAAVPLLFFFIRIWGSLRIALEFIYGTNHTTDDAGIVIIPMCNVYDDVNGNDEDDHDDDNDNDVL